MRYRGFRDIARYSGGIRDDLDFSGVFHGVSGGFQGCSRRFQGDFNGVQWYSRRYQEHFRGIVEVFQGFMGIPWDFRAFQRVSVVFPGALGAFQGVSGTFQEISRSLSGILGRVRCVTSCFRGVPGDFIGFKYVPVFL